jgi:hypothetical protein
MERSFIEWNGTSAIVRREKKNAKGKEGKFVGVKSEGVKSLK